MAKVEIDKTEIANNILDRLDEEVNINWKAKDTYINAILKGLEDLELIKVTHRDYCQSCMKDFENGEIVYYAVIDNSIVCHECSKVHSQKEVRIFRK